MTLPRPAPLAAADMYRARGTPRRRQLVRAEFITASCVCLALGILAVVNGNALSTVLGLWILGTGSNYLPHAVAAQRLWRPGALEAATATRDPKSELRASGGAQLWTLISFALLIAAIAVREERVR